MNHALQIDSQPRCTMKSEPDYSDDDLWKDSSIDEILALNNIAGRQRIESRNLLDLIMRLKSINPYKLLIVSRKLFEYCVEKYRDSDSKWTKHNRRQLVRSFSGFNREVLYSLQDASMKIGIEKFPVCPHPMLEFMLLRMFTEDYIVARICDPCPRWNRVLKAVNFTRLLILAQGKILPATVRAKGMEVDEEKIREAEIKDLEKTRKRCLDVAEENLERIKRIDQRIRILRHEGRGEKTS